MLDFISPKIIALLQIITAAGINRFWLFMPILSFSQSINLNSLQELQ